MSPKKPAHCFRPGSFFFVPGLFPSQKRKPTNQQLNYKQTIIMKIANSIALACFLASAAAASPGRRNLRGAAQRNLVIGGIIAGTDGDGDAAAGGVACTDDGCKGATVTATESDDGDLDIDTETYETRSLIVGGVVAGTDGDGDATAGGVACTDDGCKGATVTATVSDDGDVDIDTETYSTRKRQLIVGGVVAGTDGDGDAAAGGVACTEDGCKGATVAASASDDSLDVDVETYSTRKRQLIVGGVVAGTDGDGDAAAGAVACTDDGCKGATVTASASDDSLDIDAETYSTRNRGRRNLAAAAAGAIAFDSDDGEIHAATVEGSEDNGDYDIYTHTYNISSRRRRRNRRNRRKLAEAAGATINVESTSSDSADVTVHAYEESDDGEVHHKTLNIDADSSSLSISSED